MQEGIRLGGITWPVAIYDALGVLIPGLTLPTVLGLAWRPLVKVYSWQALDIVILGFVAGYLVQAVSRLIFRGIDALWKPSSYLQQVPDFERHVDSSVRAFFSLDTLSDRQMAKVLKDLCYSPVWDRMDNYKVFVAVADLHRALATLSILALLAELLDLAGLRFGLITQPELAGALCIFLAIVTVLLINRSRFFRDTSERVVYSAFLSYLAERRVK